MSHIAIIPARGGSKRIPKKNIKSFNGKPIIAYSIEAALLSGVFERVIVSTDDECIADVATKYKAEVPFLRPKNLADDFTGTSEVMAHAVNFLKLKNIHHETACCIYATAPFVQPEDIKKALCILLKGNWDYVFSATKFNYPVYRGFNKELDESLQMIFPEHFRTRSQDLPEAMHDAGQFYWGNSSAWLNSINLFDRFSTCLEIPSWRVQDIDTIEDWKRAELIYSLLKQELEDKTLEHRNKIIWG